MSSAMISLEFQMKENISATIAININEFNEEIFCGIVQRSPSYIQRDSSYATCNN